MLKEFCYVRKGRGNKNPYPNWQMYLIKYLICIKLIREK